MNEIDDRPGSDFDTCRKAGHVDGCPGRAGGDHELQDGWIAFEDSDGDLIEAEVA